MEMKSEKQDKESTTKNCVRSVTTRAICEQNKRVRTIIKRVQENERGEEIKTRGRRRGYKTAFITQHVLWTDGSELCIKAFTLLLYFCTRVENEPACGTKCLAKFSHLNPGGFFLTLIQQDICEKICTKLKHTLKL